MIILTEQKLADQDATEIKAIFTIIEPNEKVVAILDEHMPGWADDFDTSWTATATAVVDALDLIKEESIDDYLSVQWQKLVRNLADGVMQKSVDDFVASQTPATPEGEAE